MVFNCMALVFMESSGCRHKSSLYLNTWSEGCIEFLEDLHLPTMTYKWRVTRALLQNLHKAAACCWSQKSTQGASLLKTETPSSLLPPQLLPC